VTILRVTGNGVGIPCNKCFENTLYRVSVSGYQKIRRIRMRILISYTTYTLRYARNTQEFLFFRNQIIRGIFGNFKFEKIIKFEI